MDPEQSAHMIAEIIKDGNLPYNTKESMNLTIRHCLYELDYEPEKLEEFIVFAQSHLALEKLHGERLDYTYDTGYWDDLVYLYQVLAPSHTDVGNIDQMEKVFTKLRQGLEYTWQTIPNSNRTNGYTAQSIANYALEQASRAIKEENPNFGIPEILANNLVATFTDLSDTTTRKSNFPYHMQTGYGYPLEHLQETNREMREYINLPTLFFIVDKIPGRTPKDLLNYIGLLEIGNDPEIAGNYEKSLLAISRAIELGYWYYLNSPEGLEEFSIDEAKKLLGILQMAYPNTREKEGTNTKVAIELANDHPDILFHDIYTELQRDVLTTFLMNREEGYTTIQEVADALGKKRGTVRARLEDAMRRYLERDNLFLYESKLPVESRSLTYRVLTADPVRILETCDTLSGREIELLNILANCDRYNIPSLQKLYERMYGLDRSPYGNSRIEKFFTSILRRIAA